MGVVFAVAPIAIALFIAVRDSAFVVLDMDSNVCHGNFDAYFQDRESIVGPSRPAAPSRRMSSAPPPAAAHVPPESANALEARPPVAASRRERARAAAHSLAALSGKAAAQ